MAFNSAVTNESSSLEHSSASSVPPCEEIVYYSFSVQAHLASIFSTDQLASARLADIEEECKCSILVNSNRNQCSQEQGLQQSVVSRSHQRSAGHMVQGDVTVEVLMDEVGGNYKLSIRRFADLIRSCGGQWRIRRLIKKLSLADGTSKYRVEQQQQQQQQQQRTVSLCSSGFCATTLSPDSGNQMECNSITPVSGSVVMSFADEADGHWSLYSMVSPFMELRNPSMGHELIKHLWIHAVRLLASSTRSLVTEAAASELINFSSYSMSNFDVACIADTVSNDGDSHADDQVTTGTTTTATTTTAAAAAVATEIRGSSADRNFSHEPQPSLTLLLTALLCARGPPGEDMIDNMVSSTSNSLLFSHELRTERLQPSFTEPLLMSKTSECHLDLQRAFLRNHAQSAISTCRTNSTAHVVNGSSRTLNSDQMLCVASCTCLPHALSQRSGQLSHALSYPDELCIACQQVEQFGQAAGNVAQFGCLRSVAAHPIECSRLSMGLIQGQCSHHSMLLDAAQLDRAASTLLEQHARHHEVAQRGGCAVLHADGAASCQATKTRAKLASALASEQCDCTACECIKAALVPERHPVHDIQLPPSLDAEPSGRSAACFLAAASDCLMAAGADVFATTEASAWHNVTCQLASGLPRLHSAAGVSSIACSDSDCRLLGRLCDNHNRVAASGVACHAPCQLHLQPAGIRHRCTANHPPDLTCESCIVSATTTEGLCQTTALGTLGGLACSDCHPASGALTPFMAAPAEACAGYQNCVATDGTLRSDVGSRLSGGIQQCLTPLRCRKSVATAGQAAGISCTYQQTSLTDAVGARSALYSMTFSPLTELSLCAARRLQCAGAGVAANSPIFPRCHQSVASDCAGRGYLLAAAAEAAACRESLVAPASGLSLPLIELHHHHGGGAGGSGIATVGNCLALSMDKLRTLAAPRRSSEVMETIVTLGAPECGRVCPGVVSGLTLCNHSQEVQVQVRLYDRATRDDALLSGGSSWQQLVGVLASTVAALDWAFAWPSGRHFAVQSGEAPTVVLLASVNLHRLESAGGGDGTFVPRGKVLHCSELVWESRRRVQLTHAMLS